MTEKTPSKVAKQDPWSKLRDFTDARIALGRTGGSLPTRALLAFQADHAMARDAVYAKLDTQQIEDRLIALSGDFGADYVGGFSSQAEDRDIYLQRPDLGRQLAESTTAEAKFLIPGSLLVLIADGLSATAVNQNARPFLEQWLPSIQDGWQGTLIFGYATQARVALGDQIAQLQGAEAVVVLIGERPGLSSPDSMGIYLTWAPSQTSNDAQRNCISNIRRAGLGYAAAARKLNYLLQESRRLNQSGVAIKDRSDDHTIEHTQRNFLIPDVTRD